MLEHILLPLDGSALAERVLPHAISLAEAFGSRLSLLRVVSLEEHADQQSMVNPMNWQMRKSEAEAYLKSIQNRLAEVEVDCVIQILEGRPAHQIIEFAQQENVSLIVLSSHGSSGVSEWNINSTVQKVLLRAFMPVMIIRAYQDAYNDLKGLTYQNLFVALDGSKRAECILALAKSISDYQDSKIFLTHVVEEPKLPRQMPLSDEDEAIINKLKEINVNEANKYFDNLKTQFNEGQVETIIESSRHPSVTLHNIIDRENIDLVLLSAHGYSGENRWPYGKIALNFIAYGTTPLIIIQDLSKHEVEKTLAEKYAEQSKGH
jgi:nucleotide-binding universal stress UspA family protein